ncbi:MAG: hypothetical protein IPI49_05480 [Myxococcales bacterium]|nr:hypothetical protein [Myxococcales bacterium]HRC57768.1 hypothetical protein [Kofleriaceae bacterium]
MTHLGANDVIRPWGAPQLERLLFLHALEAQCAGAAAQLPPRTLEAWADLARRQALRILA